MASSYKDTLGNRLLAAVRECWNEVSSEEDMELVQPTCEALAHVLGFYEGVACMSGASKEDRERSRALHLRAGKKAALEGHDRTDCDGCAPAKTLAVELEAN